MKVFMANKHNCKLQLESKLSTVEWLKYCNISSFFHAKNIIFYIWQPVSSSNLIRGWSWKMDPKFSLFLCYLWVLTSMLALPFNCLSHELPVILLPSALFLPSCFHFVVVLSILPLLQFLLSKNYLSYFTFSDNHISLEKTMLQLVFTGPSQMTNLL